ANKAGGFAPTRASWGRQRTHREQRADQQLPDAWRSDVESKARCGRNGQQIEAERERAQHRGRRDETARKGAPDQREKKRKEEIELFFDAERPSVQQGPGFQGLREIP